MLENPCDSSTLGIKSSACLNYSEDFSKGTLKCANDCKLDTTECGKTPTCGNNKLDTGELCDGTQFGRMTDLSCNAFSPTFCKWKRFHANPAKYPQINVRQTRQACLPAKIAEHARKEIGAATTLIVKRDTAQTEHAERILAATVLKIHTNLMLTAAASAQNAGKTWTAMKTRTALQDYAA